MINPVAALIASGAYLLNLSNSVEAMPGPDGFAAGAGPGFAGLGFGAGFAVAGPAFAFGPVVEAALLPLGDFAALPPPGLIAALGLDGVDGLPLGAAVLRDAAGAVASMYASSKSKNPISNSHPSVKRKTCGGHYDGDEKDRLCGNVRSDGNAHFAGAVVTFCETYDVFP